MATQINYNEEFDAAGNLLSRSAVEITIPDADPAMAAFANSLTEQQRAALLAALQGTANA
jgi:hypothetical protein